MKDAKYEMYSVHDIFKIPSDPAKISTLPRAEVDVVPVSRFLEIEGNDNCTSVWVTIVKGTSGNCWDVALDEGKGEKSVQQPLISYFMKIRKFCCDMLDSITLQLLQIKDMQRSSDYDFKQSPNEMKEILSDYSALKRNLYKVLCIIDVILKKGFCNTEYYNQMCAGLETFCGDLGSRDLFPDLRHDYLSSRDDHAVIREIDGTEYEVREIKRKNPEPFEYTWEEYVDAVYADKFAGPYMTFLSNNSLQMMLTLLHEISRYGIKIRACHYCGKIYVGQQKNQKYCSKSCARRAKTIHTIKSNDQDIIKARNQMKQNAAGNFRRYIAGKAESYDIECFNIPQDKYEKDNHDRFTQAVQKKSEDLFKRAVDLLIIQQENKVEDGLMSEEDLVTWLRKSGRKGHHRGKRNSKQK